MRTGIRHVYVVASLALAVAALAYVVRDTRGVSGPAPVVLTSTRPGAVSPREPRYVARDLLAKSPGLSAQQRRALGDLARDWEREESALDGRLQAAQATFEQFMTMARQKGRISVAEIQSASADLREVSAELRERRAMHSEASMSVLMPAQREAMRRGPAGPAGGSR